MLLADPIFVCLFCDQVGLENHVQGEEDSSVGQEGNIAELEGSDPLQDPGVLVDDLSLFEVEGVAGVLRGHLHKGLVSESRVVDILLQFEQSVDRSTEKLGMAQSVGHIGVLFLWLDGNVVFVAFAVVVVVGDGSVQSLLLPLHDVLEGQGCIPGSIRHEAILVRESPDLLVINVPAGEAQVGEGLDGGTIGTQVGVDAGSSSFVRTVELGDGVPNFPLYLEIILEVVDDCVVFVGICFVVVLIEFGCNVVGGARVLVGQGRVGAIVEEGVFLYEPEVGFFFVEVKDA